MLTFNDLVLYICPILIINSSSINVSTIRYVNIKAIVRIISVPYWFMDYTAWKYTCWFGPIFFATILVWAWPRFMPKILTYMTLNRPTKFTICMCVKIHHKTSKGQKGVIYNLMVAYNTLTMELYIHLDFGNVCLLQGHIAVLQLSWFWIKHLKWCRDRS